MKLSLGPVLFYWDKTQLQAFYSLAPELLLVWLWRNLERAGKGLAAAS